MPNYHPPFLTSTTYHIYNHANGDDNIFREQDNYRFFLEKYVKYINPVADTFAYCLMRNHFHLMVRIKDVQSFNISSKTSKVFEDIGGLELDEKDIAGHTERVHDPGQETVIYCDDHTWAPAYGLCFCDPYVSGYT